MKRKKRKLFLCICICLFVLVAILCSCISDTVIYREDGICVTQVNKLSQTAYSSYEWSNLSIEKAYQQNPLVIRGKVRNIRELKIEFLYKEKQLVDYITVFDFEVSDYLINTSSSIANDTKILTIGYSFSSRDFAEGIPVLEEGKEFLLFCQVLSERDTVDPQNKKSYLDCWVFSPYQLMLEKVGNYYLATDFWGEYLPEDQLKPLSSNTNSEINAVLLQRIQPNSGYDTSVLNSGYMIDSEFFAEFVKTKTYPEVP